MDTALTLFLNGSDSIYLDGVALFATKPMTWIPLYVAILYVLVREHDFKELAFIVTTLLFAVLLSDQISSSIVKPLVARLRPTHDPSILHLVDVVAGYRGGKYGFFSSHASNTAVIATMLSCIFRNRKNTIVLVAWCVLNCWTRVYLGVHFVGDILAGLLFGSIFGVLGYVFLVKYLPELKTTKYSATRLSIITNVFLLTLVILTIPWKVAL